VLKRRRDVGEFLHAGSVKTNVCQNQGKEEKKQLFVFRYITIMEKEDDKDEEEEERL
jgi:hypothetical protein